MADARGPVPGVQVVPDVGAGRSVASRLRSAVGSAVQAGVRLDGAVPGSWSGKAASGYFEARGELSGRLGELEQLCGLLAAGVDEYLDVVEVCSRKAAAAGQRVQVAEAKVAASVGVEVGGQQAELEGARADLDRAVGEYRVAVERLSGVARSVSAGVVLRPESFGEHARVAGETAWELGVAGPVAGLWSLGSGLVRDPSSAGRVLSTVAGSVWEQVTDPVGTVDEMFGGPHYRAGRWGQAVGTTASVVGLKGLGRLDVGGGNDTDGDGRGGGGGGPRNPGRPLQSVDELLGGADLLAHEGPGLGHTIARHVDVDDDYLIDRLDNGTLLSNGKRTDPPKSASAWKDQETAERIITDVLRANEDKLRAFASNDKKELHLDLDLPEGDFGRWIERDDPTRTPREPNGAWIVVRRSPEGQPYILTAYPIRR